MAVNVKNDIAPKHQVLKSYTIAIVHKAFIYVLKLDRIPIIQKVGCDRTPTKKSAMAKPRMRILEGVRREGVLEIV
jgi:hypothetical protein